MELKSQFGEFLSAIRPTDTQKEAWRGGSNTLRTRLANDPDLKDVVVATFLQGSVRRSTAVRPLGDKRPDVDVVVVTTIDHTTTSPHQALDKFKPFLERHYKGKWRPQGRSFGIELSYVDLDLVVTALPQDRDARAYMQRLYRSEAVLTNDTLEDASSWRLNENWHAPIPGMLTRAADAALSDEPLEKWRPHPLLLPDRDVNAWGRTHPLAQIQWTSAKNRSCNGHYVNIVRALKWWRQTNQQILPKYPKGYPLEHMIGTVLSDGTTSMARGLVDALESIRNTWAHHVFWGTVPVLADHGVPEHNVLKRLSSEDFKAFHKAASEAADVARQALESTDAQESADLWRSLLGTRFPQPGPRGGDRSAVGFTTPSQPATPAVGRFA